VYPKILPYLEAFATSVQEKVLPSDCKLRRVKYLNNAIAQGHRAIQRRWRAVQCFRSFHTAERTLEGVESMHMLRKGQVKRLDGRDAIRAGEVRCEPVRCRRLMESSAGTPLSSK
jgi:transposase-like protein